MIAQSKQRRVKTPSAPVRQKFESITKPVQSEFPTPVLMRSEPIEIPVEPTKITFFDSEPVPEVKAKKKNAWISHVKSLAESKGIKFRSLRSLFRCLSRCVLLRVLIVGRVPST